MQNYNFIQKNLHSICLKNSFIKKSLFEIEKNIFKNKDKDIVDQNHIFITGLPRSITTGLLLFIYSSDEYASLTYRDMPFVMSPNLFSKFSFYKKISKKERLHSDGIFYDLDSPEAFDEIFFSSYQNSEIEKYLSDFISLVLLKYKKKKIFIKK